MSERGVKVVFAGVVGLGLLLGLAAVLFSGPLPAAVRVAGTKAAQTAGPAALASAGSTQGVAAGSTSAGKAATTTAVAGSAGTEDTQQQPLDQPARMGAQLGVVDNPPPGTIAILDAGSAPAGSAYDVTFAPYGIGPGGDQLVIKVLSSTARPGIRKPFQLSGRNALVNVAADAKGVVVVGGQYLGTVTLAQRQGLLVPELSQVTVVRVRK